MRIIQKQVSLEPMTSRLPGLFPAYKDGELYFFDEKHLKARGHEFPTNWGMIPVLLRLNYTPSTSHGCDDYSVSCTGTFTMTWERLSQWYYFFTEYYRLLNEYGHCGVKYESAVDYYENESRQKYAEQMKYGINRETYERLDEIFADRGGKVSLGKSGDCITGATDTGFYCWLRKNIISTPETVQSNVDTINSTIETQLSENCTGKWANDCFIPTIDDAINLQVTIDDIGEFGIFCSEYEMGVNYYSDIIYRDGKSMTIKSGQTGYRYDEIFKEMVINDVDWEDYTDKYVSANSELYDTNFTYYGFRSDGTKITGDTEKDVENGLVSYYQIVEKPGVMINGDIYTINAEEYFTYPTGSKGKTYYVFREKDTETPYTYLNGKKIYASLNTSNVTEICYRFAFKSGEVFTFPRKRTETTQLQKYISYNGGSYPVDGKSITMDNITYSVIDGYFNSDAGILYYRNDTVGETTTTKVYRWYALEMEDVSGYNRGKFNSNGEWVDDVNGNLFKKTDDNPIIYNTGQLTGITSSKLETLASNYALVDDAGYTIPGRYDASGKKNSQPQEGEELDLLYEVGNTANIMPYKKTKSLLELLRLETTEDKNYFIGDIIVSMTFYYKDIDGSKYPKSGYSWTESSLKSINATKALVPSGATLESENVFCDIVYLMGTTLIREKDDVFKVYEDGDLGVSYTETVEFEKKNVEYHLKDVKKKSTPMEKTKPSSHSISYPVVCYVIKKKEVEIDGETRYIDNTAYFISDTFKCKNGVIETEENDYVANNTIIFPNLRLEYMFGSATMQSVDANIYIDRGINAALDKHLKLGEVTSMEALENYTNGYFKMMNN